MKSFKQSIIKISLIALVCIGVYGATLAEKADACVSYPQCCQGGGAIVYAQICGGAQANIPWNQLTQNYTPSEFLRNCYPTNAGIYQDALGNYSNIDGCEKARAGLGTYVGTPWTSTTSSTGLGGIVAAGQYAGCGAACAQICYTCIQYATGGIQQSPYSTGGIQQSPYSTGNVTIYNSQKGRYVNVGGINGILNGAANIIYAGSYAGWWGNNNSSHGSSSSSSGQQNWFGSGNWNVDNSSSPWKSY
jgi:hypothetical protein